MRFESSKGEPGELVSLKDYMDRAQEGQKNIYYVNGPNRDIIENGPYMEVFKKRDIEVVYTKEAVDDYIFDNLGEYEGMKLTSADQADLELPETDEKAADSLAEADIKELTEWLKTNLGEKVTEVRVSKRLSGSPALVLNPAGISNSMQRMMQLMNKEALNVGAKIFEINPSNGLIKRLNELRKTDDEFAKLAAEQIFANALMAAGLVDDPRVLVERMNQILERALK